MEKAYSESGAFMGFISEDGKEIIKPWNIDRLGAAELKMANKILQEEHDRLAIRNAQLEDKSAGCQDVTNRLGDELRSMKKADAYLQALLPLQKELMRIVEDSKLEFINKSKPENYVAAINGKVNNDMLAILKEIKGVIKSYEITLL